MFRQQPANLHPIPDQTNWKSQQWSCYLLLNKKNVEIFFSLCPLSHSIVLARLRLWYHQLPGYRYQFVPHSTWPSNSSWDRHVDLVGKNFQKKKTFYSEAPESRSCHLRWWSCKESIIIYICYKGTHVNIKLWNTGASEFRT